MSTKSQILGFRLAGMLVPGLAIAGFQFFISEPSQALAYIEESQFLPLPVIPEWGYADDITDPQAVSSGFKTTSSPFWYDEVELVQQEQIPEQTRPQFEEPDPIFVLTTVLPSPSRSLAVINGKPWTIGSEILPGWTLSKIMGKERYVILKHSSGKRVRVEMKSP